MVDIMDYQEISQCFNDIYDCRYPTFEDERYGLGEVSDRNLHKLQQGHKKFIVFEGREVLHDDCKKNINTGVLDAVNKLLTYLPIDCELTLVFDLVAGKQLDTKSFPDNVKIEFMPFWLVFTHCAHEYHNQASVDRYTDRSDKFLYMPGKVSKAHRIAVLQAMHCNRWFDKQVALWSTNFSSLPKSGKYVEQIQEVIRLWDSNQGFMTTIPEFCEYDNQLDYDLSKHVDHHHFHITGIPYDVEIYNSVGFDIVSETNFSGRDHEHLGVAWMTEKTYRPMYNTTPFIHICQSANDTLKSLGFKTYENLYGVSEFSQPDTRNFFLEFTKAVKNMVSCIRRKDPDLANRAIHNKQHSIQLANQYVKKYDSIVENFADFLVTQRAHPNCLH